MKTTRRLLLCLSLVLAHSFGFSQSTKAPVAASRYFQITLKLNFVQASGQDPATEAITTEVAVGNGKPGSCKARMLSQLPAGTGSATKYIELGTKLDCNNVRIEGNGIALDFVLETSSLEGMAKTKGKDGMVFEEPLISQRNVQLSVKLPLGQPSVVFDSSAHPLTHLKSPPASEDNSGSVVSAMPLPSRLSAPMLIEMTATELN